MNTEMMNYHRWGLSITFGQRDSSYYITLVEHVDNGNKNTVFGLVIQARLISLGKVIIGEITCTTAATHWSFHCWLRCVSSFTDTLHVDLIRWNCSESFDCLIINDHAWCSYDRSGSLACVSDLQVKSLHVTPHALSSGVQDTPCPFLSCRREQSLELKL